ncbi:MAG: glutamate synthase subunit beta [Pirellula sp.]
MGKPTGFKEFERKKVAWRLPIVRLEDYREIYTDPAEEHLRTQGARCMDCGVPFCQSASGCPIQNLIPEWNDLVYTGRWKEALDRLHKTNNFPEFTGRVCPAPCEGACVLGITNPPVTIKNIECAIIDRGFQEGWVTARPPAVRSGKKIAIIGSGPAGLAAADQLNKTGHSVTVYERADRIGGLLTYGIPNMKLDKGVVQRRLDLMAAEGVRFVTGADVGKNVDPKQLMAENDAVLLATGATKPRDLPIPGRQLKGVHFAMEFLKQQNQRVSGESVRSATILAQGKQVVVIGGGDTGSDCVGTSNRQGAAGVTQFELLPQPPAQRTERMPWPTYPMILKTTSSHEEGVQRQWATATKAFIGDIEGNLQALRIVDLQWKMKGDGTYAGFEEVAGTEREIPCELALLAMGFVAPQREGLLQQLDIELDERGNVKAMEGKYQTSIPKIFTAGDMRR